MSVVPLVMSLLLALVSCPALAAPLTILDDYRSPRNKERPLRKATSLIVLHTTEAPARSSLNKLSERGEAHYCVTEKGIVYRIVDRDREAFHAGRSMWKGREDCDEYAIGIEVVGYHNKAMPHGQLAALKELIRRLKTSYKLKDVQVVCHSHVAYGAPNTWHPKKHRGRKRCGMLFAMPSVRAKLGLTSRPAYDPDVRAKRLVQGDSYLSDVLYARTDTMASYYGRNAALVAAPPAATGGDVTAKVRPAIQKPPVKPGKTAVAAKSTATKNAASSVLPLPKNLVIGKKGDDIRDLEALTKLPRYRRGGPVSLERTPFKIAGRAWNAASTYYYTPRGKILRGDKIDEKAIEPGTWVFYRKN